MTVLPLPWQYRTMRAFAERFDAGRMPHALLIQGAPGIGKAQFSNAAAAFLQCQQPDSGVACGSCRSCKFAVAGSHPDRFMLVPAEPSKPIRVDEVRAMGQFVSRTPQLANCKVVIIRPAEAMNHNAANSLLKNLEEPPGATYLLLVSAAPSRLAATVRSRCQDLLLPLPERQEALGWLREHIGNDAEKALDACAGRPMNALESYNSGHLARAETVQNTILAYLRHSLPLAVVVEACAKIEPAELLSLLQNWLQDLSRWQACGDGSHLRQHPSQVWCGELSNCATPRQVQTLLQLTIEAARMQASRANPNWQLLIEDLLLRWREVFGAGGQ